MVRHNILAIHSVPRKRCHVHAASHAKVVCSHYYCSGHHGRVHRRHACVLSTIKRVEHTELATGSAVLSLHGGRFGVLGIDETNQVHRFNEKSSDDVAWINGGFFVCEPSVFDLIDNDSTIWEREPLESLATSGNLLGYKHHGFWKPMDSLKDKNDLNALWDANNAPWKKW